MTQFLIAVSCGLIIPIFMALGAMTFHDVIIVIGAGLLASLTSSGIYFVMLVRSDNEEESFSDGLIDPDTDETTN
jgi:hypothetical protein